MFNNNKGRFAVLAEVWLSQITLLMYLILAADTSPLPVTC